MWQHLMAGTTGFADSSGGQRASFQHFWQAAPRPSDSKPGFDSRRSVCRKKVSVFPPDFSRMFWLLFCIDMLPLCLGTSWCQLFFLQMPCSQGDPATCLPNIALKTLRCWAAVSFGVNDLQILAVSGFQLLPRSNFCIPLAERVRLDPRRVKAELLQLPVAQELYKGQKIHENTLSQ